MIGFFEDLTRGGGGVLVLVITFLVMLVVYAIATVVAGFLFGVGFWLAYLRQFGRNHPMRLLSSDGRSEAKVIRRQGTEP